MTKHTKEWYASWFDSPFYHILYKDRNEKEAQHFMDNLTEYLNVPEGGEILDLACGKGRHALYLNALGYHVTGVDLSPNSIAYAKQFENDSLHFDVHDMTKPFHKTFDAVFNLFTSFGYFENDIDDILVLKNIKNGLKQNGFIVLDFLNVVHVKNNLVTEEIKTVAGIKFNLQREITDGFILKHISFNDKGISHSFTEKVKYLDLEKFETYFSAAGLKINHIFGNYQLSKFNSDTSDRLIFVAS